MKPPVPAVAARLLALALLLCSAAPVAAGDDALAAAEAALGDAAWAKRLEAVERLDAMEGDGATKALLRALEDDDWGVEARAAEALGKRKDGDALGPLARLAVEGEVELVRAAARRAMESIDGAGAAARLMAAARQARDPDVRARCISAFGWTADGSAWKGLRDFLGNKDPGVSAAAVAALGHVAERNESARDEILKLLQQVLTLRSDRRQFFAYAAVLEALGRTGRPAAAEILVAEVANAADHDGYVPERAARALALLDAGVVATSLRTALASARSPDALRRVVRLAARLDAKTVRPEMEPFLKHGDERVRSETARALGLLGDAASADALEKAFADRSPRVRREVVTARAKVLDGGAFRALADVHRKDADEEVRLQFVVETVDLGDPAGIDALKPFLDDPSWRVASAAAVSVGTLGIGSDLPLVEPRLRHRDWRIRAAAYEAMGRLRAIDAIPLLADGLTDPDPVVKGVCFANLQILTRDKGTPDPSFWKKWYQENSKEFVLVKRSRRSAEEKKKDEEDRPRYAHEIRKYGVEILQKARILVVLGAWDKVELVLKHLDIPMTPLRAQQIKAAGLNPNQVVLINCEGNLDKDSAARIQWFVNVGGYVMSTDWALTKAINSCFPGYLKQFPGSNTGNDVVVVEEATPGHPFTRNVFEGVPAMMWWLEIQAFPLLVEYPERCEVIVDSAEMRQRYGSSPMAATFRWGLGKVQHSLSHFYLQEEGMTRATKPRDRMVFAMDHLGLSLDQLRTLVAEGRFEGKLNEETMKKIAPDYSMFRLIVNVVAEKSRWVEDL